MKTAASVVKSIKDTVRMRDGYRCTACGMSNADHFGKYRLQLHVHRLQPGSKYTVDGCVTLCIPCHAKAARRLPGEEDVEARLRLMFDCPERLRRAIKLRAAETGKGMSDSIVDMLSSCLSDELERADAAIAKEAESEKKPRKRPSSD